MEASQLIAGIANSRLHKARSAIGRGIRYKLGQGGFDPLLVLPTRNMFCDCSGFVAWVIGIDRFQGDKGKLWSKAIPWIETSAIYNDATGPQRLFVQIPSPIAGCIVVYPDRKIAGVHFEGHVGLVSVVRTSKIFDVIDCSSSKGGKVKQAIREWDRSSLFMNRGAIFVVLKQDLV